MFKLIKKFNRKDIGIILLCLILISFQVFLDLKLPDYMSKVTTIIQTNPEVSLILEQGFYMLLCAGGSLISAIIVGYLSSLLSSSFSKNIRKQI